jgi:uncharacterized phiE125 gp8 family phage protein
MAEPVTLALAKQHLRVDHDDEDDLISGIIADARGWVEDYTGQLLVRRPVSEALDHFREAFVTWPIASVAEVSYIDVSGEQQTLSSDVYEIVNGARPARLRLKAGKSWPSVSREPGSIIVDLVAGFDDPETVPRGLNRAMMLLIGGFYADRETGGLSGDIETAARNACGAGSRGWRL